MNPKLFTIPTFLTLFRLGFALTVSPFLLFNYLPLGDFYINKYLALMMLVLVFTDYLDGYLARSFNLVTSFGRIMDPLADKCLVLGSLFILVILHKIALIWVLIVIIRECLISGMRYSAGRHQKVLPVSNWGKWKSTIQYVYLIYVVGMPWFMAYDAYFEKILLVLMVGITIISACFYSRTFLKIMNKDLV